ncbi:MAG TPA: flagellar assembly protein FliH [Thiobacillaceae bacterium]|nr:flagellar assembly protein FliH [Thiobacillaceae bacterium]HNU64015.1 flagellar assembly protein FliH [Thiobacillaceae bacterium]
MSKVIPKEQLTAYQRWELASLEDPRDASRTTDTTLSQAYLATGGDAGENGLAVNLPTAEELERIHQEAWREGHALGQEEGHRAGFELGRQEGERYARQLRALTEALETERVRQDETLAQEILTLALTVAQQVVGASLRVRQDLILVTMRDALASLPSLNGHYRVVVHPDNAQVVRDWLSQEQNHLSWKLVTDEQMEPGGFRFESSLSELDASLRTRWREIAECLGTNTEWLS